MDPVITPIIVEHMVARSPGDGRNIGQGLDYHNFVAVCHGNRGPHGSRTISDLTCDGHKGNAEFRKVNPCRPETLTSITYTSDGKIDAAYCSGILKGFQAETNSKTPYVGILIWYLESMMSAMDNRESQSELRGAE